MASLFISALFAIVVSAIDCPNYEEYAREHHDPFTEGRYEFPYQRPGEQCRTYKVAAVENVIDDKISGAIGDPDLYRLFQNSWPNTLDTTVKWQGRAVDNPDEEV